MATKSIGATGRDYATLALWVSYLSGLSISAPEVGEMYNDSEFVPAGTATIPNVTGNSSTNTVTLKCASGQSFRDNANKLSNALRYNQSNGVGVRAAIGYGRVLVRAGANTIIDGIQIKNTSTSGAAQALGASGTGTGNTYSNLVLEGAAATYVTTAYGTTVQNCAVIQHSSGAGRGFQDAGGNCTVTDLTVVASNGATSIGYVTAYSGSLVKNTAVAGFTTDYSGTASASSTNNATDKGTFGGTNFGGSGQTSLTATTEWESVTNNSEDLRLKSTSAKLKDNGATTGPTNDIAGTSRPQGSAYDIGCWELVAAAAFKAFWVPRSQIIGSGIHA